MSDEMPDDSVLLRTIGLGMDIKVFKKSPVGKFLLDRAEMEAVQSFNALKIADPEDPRLIRELQNKIKVAESFELWLEEGIESGKNAEDQYEASRLD